jgi:hypothetical protein
MENPIAMGHKYYYGLFVDGDRALEKGANRWLKKRLDQALKSEAKLSALGFDEQIARWKELLELWMKTRVIQMPGTRSTAFATLSAMDDGDVLYIDGHGSKSSHDFYSEPGEENSEIAVDQVAKNLHKLRLPGGKSILIKLLCCYAGGGASTPEPAAQALARALAKIPDCDYSKVYVCGYPGETDSKHAGTRGTFVTTEKGIVRGKGLAKYFRVGGDPVAEKPRLFSSVE